MSWYYAINQEQMGPVSEEELRNLAASGTVTTETLVWQEGMPSWIPYSQINAPATAVGTHCVECNQSFPADSLLSISGSFVCDGCKQGFLQRLQEGSVSPTAGNMEYAGFLIRFAARFVDGIVLNICSMGIGFVIGMVMANSGQDIGIIQLVAQLAGFAFGFAYEVFFVAKFGATPGKMALKLKIVRPDGEPLTTGRAIGRYFGYMLSMFTIGIGSLMAAFDRDEHRALHDRVCDTRVIRV